MDNERKIVLESDLEEVYKIGEHYFIVNKKDLVCVLPYTLDEGGLLDKIGVLEVWNSHERRSSLTLLKNYLSEDDGTNLVGANRVFYEVSGINITEASKWMYLGSLSISTYSDSPLRVYAVNISDVDFDDVVMDEENKRRFKMINAREVAQSDDLLFLGSFTRLFNYFASQIR
jgi:hypothetical protein